MFCHVGGSGARRSTAEEPAILSLHTSCGTASIIITAARLLWSGVRYLHCRALVTEMSKGQEPHVNARTRNVLTNVERVKANRTARKVTAVYPIFDLLSPIIRVIFYLSLPCGPFN
jgi:hypothetical protein